MLSISKANFFSALLQTNPNPWRPRLLSIKIEPARQIRGGAHSLDKNRSTQHGHKLPNQNT